MRKLRPRDLIWLPNVHREFMARMVYWKEPAWPTQLSFLTLLWLPTFDFRSSAPAQMCTILVLVSSGCYNKIP